MRRCFSFCSSHVAAERVDARPYAVLLQIGRLIVNRLRQFHARLRRGNVGGSPLAAEVLRNHQDHALLSCARLLSLAGLNTQFRGLIAMPESEVENRSGDVDPGLDHFEGSNVGGKSRKRQPDGRMQVQTVYSFRDGAVRLGQQFRAGPQTILLALRNLQVGQNHLRVLLKRQPYGVLESNLERGSILGQGGESRCQNDRHAAFHPRLEHLGFSLWG